MSIIGTTPSPDKVYFDSSDNDSKSVFDMSVNDTSMYGVYSVGEPSYQEGVEPVNRIVPESEIAASLTQQVVDELTVNVVSSFESYLDEQGDQLDGGDF